MYSNIDEQYTHFQDFGVLDSNGNFYHDISGLLTRKIIYTYNFGILTKNPLIMKNFNKYILSLLVVFSLTNCRRYEGPKPFYHDFCLFQFASEEYKDKVIAAYINDSMCMIVPEVVWGWNMKRLGSDTLYRSESHSLLNGDLSLIECDEVDSCLSKVEAIPLFDDYYYYGKYCSIGCYRAVALDVTWSDFEKLKYTYYECSTITEMRDSVEHAGIKAKILSDNPFSKKYFIFGKDLRKYGGRFVWGQEMLEKRMKEVVEKNLGFDTDIFLYQNHQPSVKATTMKEYFDDLDHLFGEKTDPTDPCYHSRLYHLYKIIIHVQNN